MPVDREKLFAAFYKLHSPPDWVTVGKLAQWMGVPAAAIRVVLEELATYEPPWVETDRSGPVPRYRSIPHRWPFSWPSRPGPTASNC